MNSVCRRSPHPARSWLPTLSIALMVSVLALMPMAPARATTYELTGPNDTVVGEDQTVTTVYEDTLYDLANKFSLGSEELIRVNPGIDPWLPGVGKKVIIPGRHILPPGPHEGLIVNLPEHRLYYFPKPRRGHPRVVITYPVSIGKMDWRTPLGLTHVISKVRNPTWIPPESVRKEHAANGDPLPARVPPGPDNPLGAFTMHLAVGEGTYEIHGTNNPLAVGMPVTHGCIRMYPQDVEQLFPMVPVGTPVRLVNQPIKVAWVNGELLLEAHPPVNDEGQSFEPDVDHFSQLLQTAVGDSTVAIDWDYAHEVLKRADGVLATVGVEADLSGGNDGSSGTAPAAAQAPASAPEAPATPAVAASRATAAADANR
jgi:L,D-transpeptidase ErfK/SrfK